MFSTSDVLLVPTTLSDVTKEPMTYSARAAHAVLDNTEFLGDWEVDDGDLGREEDLKGSKFAINLNMCSSWTHIMADTLRSAAVLVAASIAFFLESVEGSVADSLATLVVSAIILVSLLPLLNGLLRTTRQIVELRNNPPVLNL